MQLPGINTVALGFEPLLQHARQCQVHIVAAEKNVVANGNAFQYQVAAVLRNGDETEIGSAAANVANQNEVANLDALAPGVALTFQPRVKRRLRLFEQRDLPISGLVGGAARQ